ncbi:MAG: GTP-dependent dephospho-CoA kinase family protein, partial [Candidatus Bathycorpusculaceae bacterium]
MTAAYILTSELRAKLKKPIGMLIRGSFAETMTRLKYLLKKERAPFVISVGDTVSKNLFENQMHPQLSVIDNKRMRRRIQPSRFAVERTIYVKNPQGTITEEAIAAIKEALNGDQKVQIVVDGEEDLLTLVAILYAPENSFVVYGQPFEGIVVVKATLEKKAEVAAILEPMKT